MCPTASQSETSALVGMFGQCSAESSTRTRLAMPSDSLHVASACGSAARIVVVVQDDDVGAGKLFAVSLGPLWFLTRLGRAMRIARRSDAETGNICSRRCSPSTTTIMRPSEIALATSSR